MPSIVRPPPPSLDAVTLAHVEQVLAERLNPVEIYGAPGGCPSCHDGELRGAIVKVGGDQGPGFLLNPGISRLEALRG